MNDKTSGFVVDGYCRLRRSPWFRAKSIAIEAQVREEHAKQLAAAGNYWQRASVEWKIQKEINRRRKILQPSRYALWSWG